MKPDYKNWIPKGMLYSLIAGTVLSLALLLVFGVFGIGESGKLRIVLGGGIRHRLCRLCKVHPMGRVCLSELFL